MLTPQRFVGDDDERRGDDSGQRDPDAEDDHLAAEGEHDPAGRLCSGGREQGRGQSDETGLEGGEAEPVLQVEGDDDPDTGHPDEVDRRQRRPVGEAAGPEHLHIDHR
jgi:hypothetical protein